MKLSRDESGASLKKKLAKLDYIVTRQNGSHIRLTKSNGENEHHITIPNHDPIKIGLLSKILNDVATELEITREELLKIINE
ncbi:MAG: type II toxin-antitoxin system HicA family toxin [Saprospiraceae bacterium]|nr:type II toxin-antitoxin system HicA family toxin [Saprospiraceae bacterium]